MHDAAALALQARRHTRWIAGALKLVAVVLIVVSVLVAFAQLAGLDQARQSGEPRANLRGIVGR